MNLKDAVFNAWKNVIDEQYGKAKYLHKNKDAITGSLADMLKERDVSLEDALSLKRDVKKYMILDPKFRRKADKTYVGWDESIEKGFDAAILFAYPPAPIEIINQVSIFPASQYGVKPIMTQQALITAYTQDRFGVAWTEVLDIEFHRHGSKFLGEFEKEVLESDWCKTGVNEPEWFKKLINGEN